MQTDVWRNNLKYEVTNILEEHGLDSTVDGFSGDVHNLTDEEKDEIGEKIVTAIFDRMKKDILK